MSFKVCIKFSHLFNIFSKDIIPKSCHHPDQRTLEPFQLISISELIIVMVILYYGNLDKIELCFPESPFICILPGLSLEKNKFAQDLERRI